MERSLYRSRTDRVIAGVCGGIAQQAQIDPTLVRLVAVVLGFLTYGAMAIVYVIMAIVVPEEPAGGDVGHPSAADSMPDPVSEETTMSDESDAPIGGVPPAPEVPAAPEAPPVPEAPAAVPYAAVQPSTGVPPAQRTRRGGVWLGLVLILIGLMLLANRFIPGFDIWQYWPVAVILVGAATVVRGLRR